MKTIAEIKEAKNKIEVDILKTLVKFEADSGLKIRRIEANIDHISWREEEKLRNNPKLKPRKLKGIIDFLIHCDLENDTRTVD